MSRTTLGLASVLLSCALVGCSDNAGGSPTPDPTTSSASPARTTGPTAPSTAVPTSGTDGTGKCAEATDAVLTQATGTTQRVLPAILEGTFTECRTAFDERGMTIQWDFVAATSSFAATGREAQLPGLARREVTIGERRAWLLQGPLVGTDTVRIVMVLGDVKLSIDANDAGDQSAVVTRGQLRTGAEAVASVYVQ